MTSQTHNTFRDGHALITGASSGIGASFARELARRGLDVTLVARSKNALEDLCNELESTHGIRANFIVQDLSQPNAAQTLWQTLQDPPPARPVSVLINNAGFGSLGPFHTLPIERELSMIRLNIESLVALSSLFLERAVPQQRGLLINISSVLGSIPVPGFATYAATKAFVDSFTLSVANEVRQHGVDVCLVCPGTTSTNFAGVAGFDSNVPQALTQTPDEVVEACLQGVFSKKTTVTPGLHNKITRTLLSVTPNGLLAKASGMVSLRSGKGVEREVQRADDVKPS